MLMDEISPAFAERSIYAYVSKQLEELDCQDKELAVLAEKADGLFEWARLACEYIRNSDIGLSPKDCYGAVVSRDPAERSTLLYAMYHVSPHFNRYHALGYISASAETAFDEASEISLGDGTNTMHSRAPSFSFSERHQAPFSNAKGQF
jgi:hypothetical protein